MMHSLEFLRCIEAVGPTHTHGRCLGDVRVRKMMPTLLDDPPRPQTSAGWNKELCYAAVNPNCRDGERRGLSYYSCISVHTFRELSSLSPVDTPGFTSLCLANVLCAENVLIQYASRMGLSPFF